MRPAFPVYAPADSEPGCATQPAASLAAVQVYFNFLNEPDRLAATLEAHRKMREGDVRLVTVEVILEGEEPSLAVDDKLVVRVRHPAWYKAAGINYGARHLLAEGYTHIAWFDADTYITPARWGAAVLDALRRHKLVQLGETVIESNESPVGRAHPSIASGAAPFEHLGGWDGGGWAARGDFFRLVGLWPYSLVEGGNKVLLFPFMREALGDHPLVRAARGTAAGHDLEGYWRRLELWNSGAGVGVLRGYTLTMLPHGSLAGREAVLASRYDFYRQFAPGRDAAVGDDGFPEMMDAGLRAFVEGVLRERASPWSAGIPS